MTLIGATTENPSFALNPGADLALPRAGAGAAVGRGGALTLLERAEAALGHALPLDADARARLAELADGDGRYLLNLVETLADLPPEPVLDAQALADHLQRRLPLYDKSQESHYNLISALHKSVRGSDPDAALYWLTRMLQGGEDPRYLARRLVRMAIEDIGLADPQALLLTRAAAETFEQLGSPEGELALVQATLYLALAPKSNAAYLAYGAAQRAAREHGSLPPPMHIRNAPTRLMKQLGYGKDYAYDHDAPDRFSGQDYFPDGMARQRFYEPTERGARGGAARADGASGRAAPAAGRSRTGRERRWSTGCSTAPLRADRPPNLMDQLCSRLRADGLPLDRAGLFVEVLHPQFLGFSSRWVPDRPIEVRPAPRELAAEHRATSTAPRRLVARTGRSLRCDLTAPAGRTSQRFWRSCATKAMSTI